MKQFYALWRNRNGQQLWEGPFPGNEAARRKLELVTDTSGGSLVTSGVPMTPGERLEALPILDHEAGCPACGSDDYVCTEDDAAGLPDYTGLKQCQECGEEWR